MYRAQMVGQVWRRQNNEAGHPWGAQWAVDWMGLGHRGRLRAKDIGLEDNKEVIQ